MINFPTEDNWHTKKTNGKGLWRQGQFPQAALFESSANVNEFKGGGVREKYNS